MSHSRMHRALAELVRLVQFADKRGLSVDDARGELQARKEAAFTRRQALGGLAALGAAPVCPSPCPPGRAQCAGNRVSPS